MLCETHKLIASNMYDVLGTEFKKLVNYKSLLEGSIAPDILPSMLIIPHTKKNSSGFLKKQIEWLTNKNLFENFNLDEFSYRLGIVIHFLSDYFCTAHNHYKYINPILHHLYERKLKIYFKKNIYKLPISIEDQICSSIEGIICYLDEKHKQYRTFKPNYENDFKYSLEVTAFISKAIMGIQAIAISQSTHQRKTA